MFLWAQKKDLESSLKSFYWNSHLERHFETTRIHLSVTSSALLMREHTQPTCGAHFQNAIGEQQNINIENKVVLYGVGLPTTVED